MVITMVLGTNLEKSLLKDNLEQLVAVHKFSSVFEMGERLEIDTETTRALLDELLGEGRLEGILDESGDRFFSSKVKVSDAPTLPSSPELVFEHPNTKNGLYVAIAGLVTIVMALVFPNISIGSLAFEDIRAVFVMVGIVLFLGGLMFISRRESKKRIV